MEENSLEVNLQLFTTSVFGREGFQRLALAGFFGKNAGDEGKE
jgi:hypothetical protein